MDRLPQKEISTDPCGPIVQPGSCALMGASPVLPPRPAVLEPPLITPSEPLSKQSGLSLVHAPAKVTDQMPTGQAKSGSTPASLASISRPRPTVLGTKTTPNPTRIPVSSKEIDLIPVCIPGPQRAKVLHHSQSESSFPLHSPQSPQSPQPYINPLPSLPLSKPQPNQAPSLSPKPSLSPQLSPGSSTQSQAQSEKPGGENKDFRWDKY